MSGENKAFALAVTAVAGAVMMVIAFAWFGPGLGSSVPTASASLFDEELVQEVYREVSPAVVDINVERRVGDTYSRLGIGSGFVIDSEGHIVTNNHVVQHGDRIRVRFQDGSSATADVLGNNPANDLALLKVPEEAVADIDPASLGDSADVHPGQLAIAIGSPFGLDGSVTVGVISGTGRTLDSDISRLISGVLQTDAFIGPGNSGGPLLNREGKVVGINTAIQVSAFDFLPPRLSGQRSIGFAVPVNTLEAMLPDLKAGRDIKPPWLGINALSIDASIKELLGLDTDRDRGVYVTQVMPDSPAHQAGLVPSGTLSGGQPGDGGDLIVALEGAPVDAVGDLIAELNNFAPGSEVELRVVRGNEETKVRVTLGEWPSYLSEPRRRAIPFPEEGLTPRGPGSPLTPGTPRFHEAPDGRRR